VQTIPAASGSQSSAAPFAHARESVALKPSARKRWPQVPHQVQGPHQLVFDNHTHTDVWIGLRSGPGGSDLRVAAHGKGYFSLPAGTFRVYVFRFDQPTQLYEAGNLTFGGKDVIRSTQTVCLWFDEEDVDQATGLPTTAAR
jgi:hypothetical protein